MIDSKRSPFITKMISNKGSYKREENKAIKSLSTTVYADYMFQEHITELSIKCNVDPEVAEHIVKHYIENVLMLLHLKVCNPFTRIVIPTVGYFKLYTKYYKSNKYGTK